MIIAKYLIRAPQEPINKMEGAVKTHFKVNVGEEIKDAGVKASVRIAVGPDAQTLKTQVPGTEFQDLHAYEVIDCGNGDNANALKEAVSKFWEKVKNGEGEAAAELQRAIKPEEDEPALVEVEFKVHENFLVIDVTANEEKLEMAGAMIEMAKEQAGSIMENNQGIHLQFSIGKGISSILHSQNMVVELFHALCVQLDVNLFRGISNQVEEIAENMGAPSQAVNMARLFGAYESANLEFKFRGANELPQKIQEQASKVSSSFDPKEIRDQLPGEIKELVDAFCAHARGELKLIGGVDKLAVEISLHAPGASEFFQYN